MKKFYTAKNDIVFKTVMLKHQVILKKIIESILGEEIESLRILNNELIVINVKSKKRVVDILLQIKNQYVNVEMNNNKEDYIHIRNRTYLFNMINESIGVGEDYVHLLKNEYIGINLTYHNGGEEIRNEYKLQTKNGKCYIENFKIIEINMEKLKRSWYNLSMEEKERYKYLEMLDMEEEKLKELSKGDEVVKKYEKEIKKLNEDKEFRMHITEEEDERLIYNSDMRLAEERGIEKGTRLQAIEISKRLLAKMSKEEIASITGLSLEEIETL